jgi:hypothetical protein
MMDTTRFEKSALYFRKNPSRITANSKNQPTVHPVISDAYLTLVKSAITVGGGGEGLAIGPEEGTAVGAGARASDGRE